MRPTVRQVIAGALAAGLLAAAAPAQAGTASGGAVAPAVGVPEVPAVAPPTGGGTSFDPGAVPPAPSGGTTPQQAQQIRRRTSKRPTLTSFKVSTTRLYDLSRPVRVTFRIDGPSRSVRAKLQVLRGGKAVRTIDVGDRTTGRRHTISFDAREGGGLSAGRYRLRLSARDPRGRGLDPASRASGSCTLAVYGAQPTSGDGHRFPIAGAFSFGGDGSRFGSGRPGHIHQGQDMSAAQGTPIVAPAAGTVTTVAYQGGGAGHYIVLEIPAEGRSYVFMHLREGSVKVAEGQTVAAGTQLAEVGSTGASSGPHLHFEIWVGPWQAGGHPIDPLPELQSWAR